MEEDDPWLHIPAGDYEAHMSAVGQSAVLREVFSRVYGAHRPARLAVLGCTTGNDLRLVDPAVTEVIVGIDLNAEYLAIARQRLTALGPALQLIHGDVLSADLPALELDLVHAALLLEYVDPLALFSRIHRWLSPGGICSVITQEPTPDLPAVSRAGYESLQRLAGRMVLRSADDVAAVAEQAGLRSLSRVAANLPTGKILVSSVFQKA